MGWIRITPMPGEPMPEWAKELNAEADKIEAKAMTKDAQEAKDNHEDWWHDSNSKA